MTPDMLAAVLAAGREKQAVVVATRLPDGLQLLLPNDQATATLASAAALALHRDESISVELDGEEWFLHVRAPPFRLIVIGAVHIAQSLLPLASSLGLAVTVVDPRQAFNTAERFGAAERVLAWPDEALESLKPDWRTAVVALTHDPKLDDPALDAALRSAASYIGALGSRRSQAARLTRLQALGHQPEALARVRGPVGLALGAVSASEIALSIVAEIVAVRRGAALAVRA